MLEAREHASPETQRDLDAFLPPADLRPLGVPIMAVAGLPGVIAGTIVDEGIATRAYFVVGGTMFSVGATTYVLLNPRAKEEAP